MPSHLARAMARIASGQRCTPDASVSDIAISLAPAAARILSARRGAFLSATALAGAVLFGALAAMPAFADGGRGGGGGVGVSGGADNATAAGGAGSPGIVEGGAASGGGGGGAGVTGGAGGLGFAGGLGGPGGTTAGASGADGLPVFNDGQGGGGGGGGAHGAVISTSGALSSSAGGNGGNGGNGPSATNFGGGGGGGAGGFGAVVTGSGLSLTSSGALAGGNGGSGGSGGGSSGPSGGGGGGAGGGGTGGIGLDFTGTGNSLVNIGTISGGGGGAGGATPGSSFIPVMGASGGSGGAGLTGSGVTITNSGTISGGHGGAGGAAIFTGVAGAPGGGGAGIVGSGLTIINSGTISGGLSGNGVTRANAITFTGGFNTLELRAGSTITGNVVAFSAADTLALGGSGNASFDGSQIGSSAQYQGFGVFQKTGTSTWTLTGSNSAVMPWTVNAGTLIVNGSLANSAVTVNSGGTLAGTGTVGATTINSGGTFAPGNSPGTMTVQGNLAFQSGALYLIQVNPSTASSANVTAGGTASLAGTVQAVFAAGSYVARTYTILSAAGGRSGTFGSLATSNLPAGFTASLSYTATDAILNLTATLGQPSGPSGPSALSCGFSINQCNVANALNTFFNNGGTLPPTFVTIFGLTGGNLANALSQLSGEAATGAQKVGFQLTDQFLTLMLDPFVDGRSGVGGADHPALGFAPEREELPEDIALAYAKVLKAPPKPAPVYEPRLTVWGAGYGGSNRTTGDLAVIGSHDLSARTAGGAAGLDYRLTPDTVVGLAFAAAGTDWSLSQGLGGGKSDAFQAGLYGATKSGPAYLAAAFAFANHWMSTDRFAVGDHLTANFNAQSYGGRLEGGYRFATPYAGITPYAAIQAQSFHTPGFTESGLIPTGFALTFNDRDATDTRSELGARFDRVLAVYTNAVLALRGRVAWAHDWVSDPTLASVFQTLPGASFIVNGALPVKDSALVSAGGELRIANGVTLLAKFDGEFAGRSNTYAGTGTFRYRW